MQNYLLFTVLTLVASAAFAQGVPDNEAPVNPTDESATPDETPPTETTPVETPPTETTPVETPPTETTPAATTAPTDTKPPVRYVVDVPPYGHNYGFDIGVGASLTRMFCLSPCSEGETGLSVDWQVGYYFSRRVGVFYEGSYWIDDSSIFDDEEGLQSTGLSTARAFSNGLALQVFATEQIYARLGASHVLGRVIGDGDYADALVAAFDDRSGIAARSKFGMVYRLNTALHFDAYLSADYLHFVAGNGRDATSVLGIGIGLSLSYNPSIKTRYDRPADAPANR